MNSLSLDKAVRLIILYNPGKIKYTFACSSVLLICGSAYILEVLKKKRINKRISKQFCSIILSRKGSPWVMTTTGIRFQLLSNTIVMRDIIWVPTSLLCSITAILPLLVWLFNNHTGCYVMKSQVRSAGCLGGRVLKTLGGCAQELKILTAEIQALEWRDIPTQPAHRAVHPWESMNGRELLWWGARMKLKSSGFQLGFCILPKELGSSWEAALSGSPQR